MSSQRGNVKKSRPPKHQNSYAFQNSLHDTSHKTKVVNSLDISGCCTRCKDVLDWKVKYKKYKPLTVAKKCTKCQQKTVKRAYYILCDTCALQDEVCGRCGKTGFLTPPGMSTAEEASQKSQFDLDMRMLPERQRRTFLRLHHSGKLQAAVAEAEEKASARKSEEDLSLEGSDTEEIEAINNINLKDEENLDSDGQGHDLGTEEEEEDESNVEEDDQARDLSTKERMIGNEKDLDVLNDASDTL